MGFYPAYRYKGGHWDNIRSACSLDFADLGGSYNAVRWRIQPSAAGGVNWSAFIYLNDVLPGQATNNDVITSYFNTINDADEDTIIGAWTYQMTDVSNGTEDGRVSLSTMQAGTTTTMFQVDTVFRFLDNIQLTFGTDDDVTMDHDTVLLGLNMTFDNPAQGTVGDMLTLDMDCIHVSGSTDGFGAGIAVRLDDDGGNIQESASLDFVLTDVSNNAEKCDILFRQIGWMTDGTSTSMVRDTLRLISDSTATSADVLQFSSRTYEADAVVDIMRLILQTDNTVANNLGAGISIQISDAGGVAEQASIDFVLTDVVDTSEECDIVFRQMGHVTGGAGTSVVHETLRLVSQSTAVLADKLRFTSLTYEADGIVDIMELRLSSDNTVANNLGAGISIQIENDNSQVEERAAIDFQLTDVGDGAEDCDIIFRQQIDGATPVTARLTLDADGPVLFVGPLAITNDDLLNTVVDVLTLTHSSSDDDAEVGIGAGLSFELENITGTSLVEQWGSIDVVSTDVANTTEEGDMVFSQMISGTVGTKLLLNADGLSQLNGGIEIQSHANVETTLLVLDNDDTDQIVVNVEASNIDADVFQVTADAVTSALVMDITADALVDGGVINMTSTSNVMTTAEMLAINHAPTAITAAKTGDGIDIDFDRTLAAGAQTDNYNALSLVRTSQTSAAVTITAQGTVMYLENADTAGGSGTVTDSVDVLSIVQDANSTGQSLVIDHNGAGNAVEIASASDAATSTLDISNESGGFGIYVHRDLAAAVTDQSLIFINDDGASDQIALHIHTDAISDAGGGALFVDADLMTTLNPIELTADALTSGVGADLTSSSVNLTTNGRLLRVIHSADFNDAGGYIAEISGAFTTGRGLNIVNNVITDGFLTHINSSSAVLDATGRMLMVDHTGGATVSGILAEIASNATDETVIFRVTASSTLIAGVAVDISVASMTTGMALDISDADALTTGGIGDFSSNSVDVSARQLIHIHNENVLAVGTVPLNIENAAAGDDVDVVNLDPGTTGVILDLHHNSANPAVDDVVASLRFAGEDSGGVKTIFGQIDYIIADETAGSEEGRAIHYLPTFDGSAVEIFREEVGDLKPIRLNSQSYEWIEDFDDETSGVQFEAGLVADWWTTAGTNYNANNVTYTAGPGGTVQAVTAGSNDDSVTAIGTSIFRVNSDPILEARFKVADITDAWICVGFVEGSFADKGTPDDDIIVVGIDSDNGHGFGAAQIVAVTNDNNAGGVYNDCGVAITLDTYITIRIDCTDTEQPRIWVNNTGGQITAANEVDPTDIAGTIQAGISIAPYFMVQSLTGAADTFTIDYIKTWQTRG